LENGLRVIVVARPGLPVLSADLLIKSGAEVDPPELAGLASLTATLLTRGTAQRSATKIAEDIEALGAQIDATADWDATTVGLSALSSQAPAALEILADVVRNPAFAKDEIERARRETLDALRVAYEEPRTIALAAAQRAIFGTGAYAHMRSGTLASIARAQRESIVQLHALHYRPGNAGPRFCRRSYGGAGLRMGAEVFRRLAEPLGFSSRAPCGRNPRRNPESWSSICPTPARPQSLWPGPALLAPHRIIFPALSPTVSWATATLRA
jgi:zinc protease